MDENATLEVYKCPSCGGAVRFDAATGSLTCMWCRNVYDAEALETKRVSASLEGYLCPECGAELMADDFIAADTCPYCGNNEVAPHRFEGEFEPDSIIPFAISKQQAVECYESYIAQKDYLPDDFIATSRIGSVQGAYVPFWLKDGVVNFDCTYKSQKKDAGKNSYSERYFRRAGTYEYARIPADGSERMPDDMMDSIEPYDLDERVPFSTEYLPGFMAERYTVDAEGVDDRIGNRMCVSAILAAKETAPGLDRGPFIEGDHCTTRFLNGHEEQTLLPVWLIVIAYGGEKYLAGINGQTGKVAINLPIDEKKQTDAAFKGTIKKELPWTLPFFLVGIAIAIAILVIAPPSAGMYYAAAVFALLPIACCAWYFPNRYKREKRKVQENMQNVREAKLSGDYDPNCMTLTLSEQGMGPLSPFASKEE